jgi:HlyD family secretion protein
MKKPILILAVALVGIVAAGGYMVASRNAKKDENTVQTIEIKSGNLRVSVIESGVIDAVRSVEVKSRVTGRLARLLVDEGDYVEAGQLLAVIDPKETVFRVEQDSAQLRGAQSAVDRLSLEIEQRQRTAQASFQQAQARIRLLEMELKAQPEITKALIVQAETSLRSAEQDKERMVNSIHPTQRISAQSALEEAQANFDNAVSEHRRQSELFEKGYVAGRAVETAKLGVDLARARLNSVRENLARLEGQLAAEVNKADQMIRQAQAEYTRAKTNAIQDDVKRAEYQSAMADLEKARAALSDPAILARQRDQSRSTVQQLGSVLEDSRRQLGETEIRAPISGIVTSKGLQVGELATGLSQFSSGSAIVKIEDRTAMRVKLDVNEIDVAKMQVGMPARVNVDALPSEEFQGVVRKIAPASKSSSQAGQPSTDVVVRYEVEIELTGPSANLRSGMSAKCTVDVIDRPSVLLLPIEYAVREDGRTFVELAPSDPLAKPERRQVVVGAASGAFYEVLNGLKEGDKLVKPGYEGPERKGMMQFGRGEE